MSAITDMVELAVQYNQPALALTDHGLMSGVQQLYRHCKHAGIMPLPGEEFYLVDNVENAKAKRYHLILLALNNDGYKTLVELSSRSHQRDRYKYKPRIDFIDLAGLYDAGKANNIVALSGCYFGLPIQMLVNHGPAEAETALRTFARWFPNLCVEIQNHYTDHGDQWDDHKVAVEMHAIAQRLGLPIMVTQDSHYCEDHHKDAHDLMKALALVGSDPGDVTFPGDSYHLASTKWVKQHYADPALQPIWNAGLEGAEYILDQANVEIPGFDKYQFHVPIVSPDAQHDLNRLCQRALSRKHHGEFVYTNRLQQELDVINDVGMADYFLLIREVVQFCEQQGIKVMARGSANGSLVCYLLGITSIDPVHWNLLFERFLTRDRSKPPDIDLDIDQQRRDEVSEWLRTNFNAVQIGTFQSMGLDDQGGGSLFRMWLSMKRRAEPDDWPRQYGWMKSMGDVRTKYPADAELLDDLSDMGLRRSAGAHAAGFVLPSPAHPIEDLVPTMLIPSSGNVVTQMEMDDVESAGFMKVDVLGLRSVSTLDLALRTVGITEDDIPWDDPDTMAMVRKGNPHCVGVFQLEGWTASRGVKEIKAKSVKDIVLVMALYRTAVLDSGFTGTFLRRRARQEKPFYPNEVFKKYTKETYGVVVFQEQVIQTMTEMGMAIEDLNRLLKAVKASQSKQILEAEKVFAEARAQYEKLCEPYGMDEWQIAEGWRAIEGFSEYGFNRAHATAYGVLAYRMAYLKCHHPLEYMAAVLATTAGTDKEAGYLTEARRLGLKVMRADVNESGVTWSVTPNRRGMRKGLLSVKGVGQRAAEAIVDAAPFTDMADLIARTPRRIVTGGSSWAKTGELTGVLEKLREANALMSLGVTR